MVDFLRWLRQKLTVEIGAYFTFGGGAVKTASTRTKPAYAGFKTLSPRRRTLFV